MQKKFMSKDKTNKTENYGADKIVALKGLEPVRKRPGMYIGTTDSVGLHHLFVELLDNSVDEAINGYCDNIEIRIYNDGSLSVRDNGRGMPVDINKEEGVSGVELIFMRLHAGGKFEEGGAFEFSGGLHGVGASVVNALSNKTIVEISRNEKLYSMEMEKGKLTKKLSAVRGKKTTETGSFVRFYPDETIFETVEFDYDYIIEHVRHSAYLNSGLTIKVIDERSDREDTFYYEQGLEDFLKDETKDMKPFTKDVIRVTSEMKNKKQDIVFSWTKEYTNKLFSFCNNVITPDGGTHYNGFKSAILKVLNDYGHNRKLLKESENLTSTSVLEGLVAIISVFRQNAEFQGQTKGRLGSPDMKKFVEDAVYHDFMVYLEEHSDFAKKLIEKAQKSIQADEAAKKAKELTRKKTSIEQTATLPGKLADCISKDSLSSEVFLVEGDSAGGSAKLARDRHHQAILPLRGKILNVEKVSKSKALASDEIKNMITAFGCGVGKDIDLSKLRYDKIIIMSDADTDGGHIRLLLLTFFYRFFPGLIESGHVYAAMPPLYKTVKGKNTYYTYTEDEQTKLLNKINKAGNKLDIQRYKGLGEMSPNQLWETTMNPESRSLLRIKIEDAEAANDIFKRLMGDKVAPRREFIEKNATYATIDV